MGGSYRRQCVECGTQALSIATRCPGCGSEFQDVVVPEDGGVRELGRFLTPGWLAGACAVVAIFSSAGISGTSHPPDEDAAAFSAESIAVAAPYDTASAATATAGGAAELLVARDWTYVRKSRSAKAPLEAVLTPGDTVAADSLDRGWYRVALYGEVLGYAFRSTLAPAHKPTEPAR